MTQAITAAGLWAQALAATCAIVRAIVLPYVPRIAARAGHALPLPTPERIRAAWGLAAVVALDVANELGNRAINAWLPAPSVEPFAGLPRLAAWAGLSLYAAWICAGLAFVAWLALRRELRALALGISAGLWLGCVLAFGAGYPALRGDAALRVLGALHVATFAVQLPCMLGYARSRGEGRMGTERLCAVWLAFLSLAAGLGPLRPWIGGPIDRASAESLTAAAMLLLYLSLIGTMGITPWISTLWRYVCGFRASRSLRSSCSYGKGVE